MTPSEIITDIKKFDFRKFSWTEAVAGPDGKSSAGKMLSFWYGVVLVGLAALAGILYLVKGINKDDIQNIFLFVGTQMPIVLTYLFGNKSQEIKKEALNCEPDKPQP